jgi:hypothetical protein
VLIILKVVPDFSYVDIQVFAIKQIIIAPKFKQNAFSIEYPVWMDAQSF